MCSCGHHCLAAGKFEKTGHRELGVTEVIPSLVRAEVMILFGVIETAILLFRVMGVMVLVLKAM
jgi:hypothetical protein